MKKLIYISVITTIVLVSSVLTLYLATRQTDINIEQFLNNSRKIIKGYGTTRSNITSGIKIFIMLGQSQMMGFGNPSKFPPSYSRPNKNILRLEDEGWVIQELDPVFNGPEVSFSNYLHKTIDKVGIIKVAIGGTGIRAFIPNWTWKQAQITGDGPKGPLFDLIEKKIKLAENTGTFEGVFWKQGETDMTLPTAAHNYFFHLNNIIDGIRGLTRADLPFFVANYCNLSMLETPGYTNRQIIQERYGYSVLNSLSISEYLIKNTYVVPHGNLPLGNDGLHFNTEGVVKLGEMLAKSYLKTILSRDGSIMV